MPLAGRAADRRSQRRGRGTSRSGTRRAVTPSVATAPMPPAGVATSGVPDAMISITVFGSPSTFPASSCTDGATATSAAASSCRHDVVRDDAEKLHDVADAGACALARSDASRSPSPAIATRSCGCCAFRIAAASIRYSNPFFLTRRPTAKISGTLSAMPSISRPRARASASGLKRSLSTP